MNAVEIEDAITQVADYNAFLEAFGNKETTIKRRRAGASNKSDIGDVLQTNNIQIATSGVHPGPPFFSGYRVLHQKS